MNDFFLIILTVSLLIVTIDDLSKTERLEGFAHDANYWRGLYYQLKEEPQRKENLRQIALRQLADMESRQP
jgi:hypothetical protein